MADAFVTVERRPDNVALVRLDRPKANALSAAVLAQLESVARALGDDPPGAVVLWGGRRIFAAGADIVELGDSGARAVGEHFAGALGALASIPRATIAAVNGYALGGGLELALACDFRVCAEDARFGPARGAPRRDPGRRRHPAPAPPHRRVPGQGAHLHGASGAGRGGGRHRAGQPPGAARRGARGGAGLGGRAGGGARWWPTAWPRARSTAGWRARWPTGSAIEQDAFVAAARTEDAARGIASFNEHGPGKASFRGALNG